MTNEHQSVPTASLPEGDIAAAPSASLTALWSRFVPLLRVGLPAAIIWVVWRELATIDIHAVRGVLGHTQPALFAAGIAAAFSAVGIMGLFDLLAFSVPASTGLSRRQRWLMGCAYFGWNNFISLGPLGGPALRFLAYRRLGLDTPSIGRGLLGIGAGSACGLSGWLVAAWMPLGSSGWSFMLRVPIAVLAALQIAILLRFMAKKFLLRSRHIAAAADLPFFRLAMVGFAESGLYLASFLLISASVGMDVSTSGVARTLFTGQFFGIASMIPGGLGSADAVWIKGMIVLGETHDTAAATVLAFRAGFYIPPWVASLLVLYFWASTRSQRLVRWQRRLVAGAVMLNGVLLLLSAATPAIRDRLDSVARVVPLGAIEASHLTSAAAAVVMILVTRGLLRGYRAAYLVTSATLAASVLAHPLKGGDFEEAVSSLILLILLLGARGAFSRCGRIPVGWETTLAAGVGSLAFFVIAGLASFGNVPYTDTLWTDFAERAEASRFLRAMLVIGLVLLAALIREATRPARSRMTISDQELAKAEAFVRAHSDSADPLLLGGRDKGVWFHEPSGGGQLGGLVVCQRFGSRLFVLKDPVVAPAADPDALLGGLIQHAETLDLDLVFAMVSGLWMNRLHDFGFHFLKLGEEAIVDLNGFTLAGGKNASFRRLIRDTERAGVLFEIVEPPLERGLVEQLGEISDAWLAAKGARELQFSACAFSPEYIQRNPIAVAKRGDGHVVGFVNILRTRKGGPVTIDLMRSAPGAPSNVMDYIIINTMRAMAESGYGSFSLGGAPLSDVGVHRRSRMAERALRVFSLRAERIYNYQGLRLYKGKFHPRWEPRFLAFQQPWDWTGSLVAYARLVEARSPSDRARIAAARTRACPLGGGPSETQQV